MSTSHVLPIFRVNGLGVLILLCLFAANASAQKVNEVLINEFNASPTLYVLDRVGNKLQLTTGSGEIVSFLQLVEETWPDKEVKLISETDYNTLPDVKTLFHITIEGKTTTVNYERPIGHTKFTSTRSKSYSWEYVHLQKGKTAMDAKRSVSLTYLDWRSIQRGELPERLGFAISTLRDMTTIPIYGSTAKSIFQSNDFSSLLKTRTLYIQTKDIPELWQTQENLESVYPYPCKPVGDSELQQAIIDHDENVLYLEEFDFGDASSFEIRETKTGRLVYRAYPVGGMTRSVFIIYKRLAQVK